MINLFKKDRFGIPKIYEALAYVGASLMGVGFVLKHYNFDNYKYFSTSGYCISICWILLCLFYSFKNRDEKMNKFLNDKS